MKNFTASIPKKNISDGAMYSNTESCRQLVVVDPTVSDYQILLSGISPNTEVYILDPNRDGIEQITEILAGLPAEEQLSPLLPCSPAPLPPCSPAPLLSSLHLITHGSPGTLYLGNSTLELSNIEQYRHQLQQWGIAHLYIYGCKVAAGDAGAEFLTKLHQITQAEIYANPHLTGNAAKGGTWNLQQILPCPPAPLLPSSPAPLLPCSPALFSPETLATYPGLLLEPEYEWATNVGIVGGSIVVDSSSNIYTIGTFRGTRDFDPGPGTANLTSLVGTTILDTDIFIRKLNADGTFAWAKSFGGSGRDISYSIAVDSSGNVYTTGWFYGTADFDPGPGTFNLTEEGSPDRFISKLNADGTFAWAKSLEYGGYGIAVDSSDNVYTVGGILGDSISKLNADGTLVWAKNFTFGNPLGSDVQDIAVDSSGNVYTAGVFTNTADFDPGPGTFNLTSAGNWDIFISKLNPDGTFAWAKSFGGSGNELRNNGDLAVDSNGNVYTTGWFQNTVDFDPGDGTFNLTSSKSGSPFPTAQDTFMSKLNADGTFAWAKSGDKSHSVYSGEIAVDSNDNIYTTGGGGINKLNAEDGTLAWTKKFESSDTSSNASVSTIVVDSSDNIYTTGIFSGTADFDPGVGTANLTSAEGKLFISKLVPGVAPTVTLSSTATATVNDLFAVTATFSEVVTGFVAEDILVPNGTVGNLQTTDHKTYTFDVTPTASGQVTVDIPINSATDSAGNNNTAANQLQKTAVLNSPPTLSDISKTGNEDTEITFAATDFTDKFSDPDSDSLSKIKITSLPDRGTLKLDGTTIPAGQEINAADLGKLTFTPNADFNGNVSFTWNASDGTALATADAKVNLTISIVDDEIVDDPIVDDPIVDDPIVDDPIVDDEIVDDPIVDDEIVDDPIIDDPIVDDPTNNGLFPVNSNQIPPFTGLSSPLPSDDSATATTDNTGLSLPPAIPSEPTIDLVNISFTAIGTDSANNINGQPTDDVVSGQGGNDIIRGLPGRDALFGNNGDDELHGNQGADLLLGNQGKDAIYGGQDNDLAFGGQGNDLIYGDLGSDTLIGDMGDDQLFGGTSKPGSVASDGGDLLFGKDGNDFLHGNAGDDSISGGNDNDTARGGQGNDLIHGDAGADILYGDKGNDNLAGGTEDDVLYGGEGNDILWGGDGEDFLYGGAGDDTVIGGAGKDYFAIQTSFGADTILDFTNGIDLIGLAGGLTFDQLSIAGNNGNTLISRGNELLATLTGVDVGLIDSADFTLLV